MGIWNTILSFLLFLSLFVTSIVIAEEVRIGATLPLTGDAASYGGLIRNGIEIAVEDLKKEGFDIKLFIEDTPLSGSGILTSLNKLIHVDKVDGIAGNFSNLAMAAMAPVIQKAKIPVFHTAAMDPLLLNAGDYIVSTNIRIRDEAYHIAEFLFQHRSLHRVGVISINANFGQAPSFLVQGTFNPPLLFGTGYFQSCISHLHDIIFGIELAADTYG
jgi:ABC-type branched-subunit amino acid transport system substrate-binding protein